MNCSLAAFSSGVASRWPRLVSTSSPKVSGCPAAGASVRMFCAAPSSASVRSVLAGIGHRRPLLIVHQHRDGHRHTALGCGRRRRDSVRLRLGGQRHGKQATEQGSAQHHRRIDVLEGKEGCNLRRCALQQQRPHNHPIHASRCQAYDLMARIPTKEKQCRKRIRPR